MCEHKFILTETDELFITYCEKCGIIGNIVRKMVFSEEIIPMLPLYPVPTPLVPNPLAPNVPYYPGYYEVWCTSKTSTSVEEE